MMSGTANVIQFATGPEQPSARTTLRQALIESRQRWRQFGALATDLVFETDAMGRLAFLAPDEVLGWAASELVGRTARDLLLDQAGPDIFSATTTVHRRPTWFRTRSDDQVCMAVSITPMLDADGVLRGTRGVAVNVTGEERASIASAASLRRAEVLDHLMGRMRQEVLAPRMMQAMLDGLLRALGAQGAAVVDLTRLDDMPDATWLLHAAGADGLNIIAPLAAAVNRIDDEICSFELTDWTQVLACPCSTRFGHRAALTAWRGPGGRAWDTDDITLIGSVGGVMRMVLEHECIQRELARQARTDSLTGLLNRRAFIEEATRRLDRLERESQPGTLMYLDLDRLKQLNDRLGHETGDAALKVVSGLLLRIFRPSDLVARLGGDEFAVWLDGADSLTAAERAEELRLTTPLELAHLTAGEGLPPGMSIGIATRDAGSEESLEELMQRADQAMYLVKRGGRGNWQVSQPDQAT